MLKNERCNDKTNAILDKPMETGATKRKRDNVEKMGQSTGNNVDILMKKKLNDRCITFLI